jgi:hypothetical protein
MAADLGSDGRWGLVALGLGLGFLERKRGVGMVRGRGRRRWRTRPRRTEVRSITTSAVAATAGSHVSCNPPPLPLLCARRGRPARWRDLHHYTVAVSGSAQEENAEAGEDTAAAITRVVGEWCGGCRGRRGRDGMAVRKGGGEQS